MLKEEKKTLTFDEAAAQVEKWFEAIDADISVIEASDDLRPLKENLLSKVMSGDVKFGDSQELIYTLKYPIDTFTEVKFKNRVQLRHAVKFTGKENFFERATKILSAYTATPTLLIDKMQDKDYNFVCGLLGFFG